MFDSTLNRREFCRAAVSAAAVATLGMPVTAADKKKEFALRYILGSCMYGTFEVADILPEVAKVGADSIDIWPRVHGNQREQIETMGHDKFKALLKTHDVKLGIMTHYDLGPYRLQKEMRVTHGFGGRIIICGAGKGTGKTLKDKVRDFVAGMQPHVAAAEKNGITIGIENHGNSLIESADSMRYLAEFSKSPKLGIALAPYHLPQDEKQIATLIGDLGDKLVHFYAWQHGMGCHKKLPKEQELLQMPGRGTLDFVPLLTALKKNDYQGWTEIFMHPVPRGIPILETAKDVTAEINRARKYLAECLKKVKS